MGDDYNQAVEEWSDAFTAVGDSMVSSDSQGGYSDESGAGLSGSFDGSSAAPAAVAEPAPPDPVEAFTPEAPAPSLYDPSWGPEMTHEYALPDTAAAYQSPSDNYQGVSGAAAQYGEQPMSVADQILSGGVPMAQAVQQELDERDVELERDPGFNDPGLVDTFWQDLAESRFQEAVAGGMAPDQETWSRAISSIYHDAQLFDEPGGRLTTPGSIGPRPDWSGLGNPLEFEADLARRFDPVAMHRDAAMLESINPAPREVDWFGAGGVLPPAAVTTANQLVRDNPVLSATGNLAAGAGRAMEFIEQRFSDPLLENVRAGQQASREAMGIDPILGVTGIPQALSERGINTQAPYLEDPFYQELSRTDPAAANRYVAENYGVPFFTGFDRALADPTNLIGPGIATHGLYGLSRAAGQGTVGRGLEAAAKGVGAVEGLANAVPDLLLERPASALRSALSNGRDLLDAAGERIGRTGSGPLAPSPATQMAQAGGRMAQGLALGEQQGVPLESVMRAADRAPAPTAPTQAAPVTQAVPVTPAAQVAPTASAPTSSVAQAIANGEVPMVPDAIPPVTRNGPVAATVSRGTEAPYQAAARGANGIGPERSLEEEGLGVLGRTTPEMEAAAAARLQAQAQTYAGPTQAVTPQVPPQSYAQNPVSREALEAMARPWTAPRTEEQMARTERWGSPNPYGMAPNPEAAPPQIKALLDERAEILRELEAARRGIDPRTGEVRGGAGLSRDFEQMAQQVGRGVDPFAEAAYRQMGPVPAQHTRLYRVEPTPGMSRDIPEYLRQDPKVQETLAATGRWFSAIPESLGYYVRQASPNGAQIRAVDVPTVQAERFLASQASPEVRGFSRNPGEESFVSPEIAARSVVVQNIPGPETAGFRSTPIEDVAGQNLLGRLAAVEEALQGPWGPPMPRGPELPPSMNALPPSYEELFDRMARDPRVLEAQRQQDYRDLFDLARQQRDSRQQDYAALFDQALVRAVQQQAARQGLVDTLTGQVRQVGREYGALFQEAAAREQQRQAARQGLVDTLTGQVRQVGREYGALFQEAAVREQQRQAARQGLVSVLGRSGNQFDEPRGGVVGALEARRDQLAAQQAQLGVPLGNRFDQTPLEERLGRVTQAVQAGPMPRGPDYRELPAPPTRDMLPPGSPRAQMTPEMAADRLAQISRSRQVQESFGAPRTQILDVPSSQRALGPGVPPQALPPPDLRGVRVGQGTQTDREYARAAMLAEQGRAPRSAVVPQVPNTPALPPGNRGVIVGEGELRGPGTPRGLAEAGVRIEPEQGAKQTVQGVSSVLESVPGWQVLSPEVQSVYRSLANDPKLVDVWKQAEAVGRDPTEAVLTSYFKALQDQVGFKPAGPSNGWAHAFASVWADLTRHAPLMSPQWHTGNVLDQISKSLIHGGQFAYVGNPGKLANKLGVNDVPGLLAKWDATTGAKGVGHEAGLQAGLVRPGVKPAIEHVAQALNHFRNPGQAGLNTTPGRLVDRTWGTLKAVNQAIGDVMEGAARFGMGLQTMERVLTKELVSVRSLLSGELTRGGMAKKAADDLATGVTRLEQWTPKALADFLKVEQVPPEITQRVMQRFNAGYERALNQAEHAVSRVHGNYSSRTNLESATAWTALLPFTKWAMNNVRFYAEALMSRPALWTVLREYDKVAQQDNELGEGQPSRLNNFIEAKGSLGAMISAVLFGDSNVHTYLNPMQRAVTMPGQQQPYIGEGATALGAGLQTVSALTGIQLAQPLQILGQMYGLYGNVPVNVPLGVRNVPGALAQTAYGALNNGRSAAVDFSRAGRNTALPGAQSLNQQFGAGRTGAGPQYEAEVMREMTQQGDRQGLNTYTSPAVLDARWNPNAERFQSAERTVQDRMNNIPQQMAQASLMAKGMQPTEYEIRQSQNRINEMQQRGMTFSEALKAETIAQGGFAPAQLGWSQHAGPEYLGMLANQTRTGVNVDREALDAQLGVTRPEYPGAGALREQLQQYYNDLERYQQVVGPAGTQVLTDRMQAEQNLANARQQAQAIRTDPTPFTDLQKAGFGPYSGDRWTTAEQRQKELAGEVLTPAFQRSREAAALTNARPEQGPGLNFEEQIQLNPEMRRAAELRGYLETLPPEQRGLAYTSNPEFAPLREWDQRMQSPQQTLMEQQWADRRSEYAAVGQQYGELLARGASAQEIAAHFQAANQKWPGGDGLPSYAEWQQRGQSLDERLEVAVRNAVYSQLPNLQVSNTLQDRYEYAARRDALDPVVQKVWAGNRQGAEKPTSQEIQYAANVLGITVPGQTVARGSAGAVPGRDDWATNPSVLGGLAPAASAYPVVSLNQRQQAVQAGALTPAQPVTPAVAGRIQTMMQPGVALYNARQAPRAAGTYAPRSYAPRSSGGRASAATRSNEPFSGTTAAQQNATAMAHAQKILETQGTAARAQWMYDNYDRIKALRDELGMTTAARSAFSRVATELSSRPAAFEGLTIRQGTAKMADMRDTINSVLGKPDWDRVAFVNSWEQKFNEKLRPEDLTFEALSAKLDWVKEQLEQYGRYSKTPEGIREETVIEQARTAVALLDEQRQQAVSLAERLSEQVKQYGNYGEIKATQGQQAANAWWNSSNRADRERAAAESKAAWDKVRDISEQLKQAREEYGKHFPERKKAS